MGARRAPIPELNITFIERCSASCRAKVRGERRLCFLCCEIQVKFLVKEQR